MLIPKVTRQHCRTPKVSHIAEKENPAGAGSGFSRDSTNWGRGHSPRGVASNQRGVLLPRAFGANTPRLPDI